MEQQYPERGTGDPVRLEGGWFLATGNAPCGRSPSLIVQANPDRYGVCIVNTGPETVFIGTKSNATPGSGFSLLTGSMLSLGTHAEVWGSSAAGTGTVSYIEEAR